MQIKSNLYNNTLSQTSKTKRDNENKVNIGASVRLGAVGGGLAGAALGWIQAQKKIDSLPEETITLTVKKPIYQIVRNDLTFSREKSALGGIREIEEVTVVIYTNSPLKDSNGNVVYKEYQQIFTGKGKPVVKYKTKKVIDEVATMMSPKPVKKVIDIYQEPVVTFKSGVSVAEHVIVGGLIGAAAGGVIGGVVAALLNKFS